MDSLPLNNAKQIDLSKMFVESDSEEGRNLSDSEGSTEKSLTFSCSAWENEGPEEAKGNILERNEGNEGNEGSHGDDDDDENELGADQSEQSSNVDKAFDEDDQVFPSKRVKSGKSSSSKASLESGVSSGEAPSEVDSEDGGTDSEDEIESFAEEDEDDEEEAEVEAEDVEDEPKGDARGHSDAQKTTDKMFGKVPKKSKSSNDLDVQVHQDEEASKLIQGMHTAAEADFEAFQRKQPANRKHLMLKTVLTALERYDYQESLLESGVCAAVRAWLEPYPDGTLTGYDIRHGLLSILATMPIQSYHLRESGLGKTIKFLQESHLETKDNKKLAQDLIYNWSKAVMGKRMDYRQWAAEKERSDRRRIEEQQPHVPGRRHLGATASGTASRATTSIIPSTSHSFDIIPPSTSSKLAASRGGATGVSKQQSGAPDKYKSLSARIQRLKQGAGRDF